MQDSQSGGKVFSSSLCFTERTPVYSTIGLFSSWRMILCFICCFWPDLSRHYLRKSSQINSSQSSSNVMAIEIAKFEQHMIFSASKRAGTGKDGREIEEYRSWRGGRPGRSWNGSPINAPPLAVGMMHPLSRRMMASCPGRASPSERS